MTCQACPFTIWFMNLLALEASASTVSIALQRADKRVSAEMPDSSKTSAWILPKLQELLEETQLSLTQLDGILFGAGPGAFTGLRTVCSVVQGLSLGLGATVPIYAVDTLLELAQAMMNHLPAQFVAYPPTALDSEAIRILSVLDARMNEWYVAAYELASTEQSTPKWTRVGAPHLCTLATAALPPSWHDAPFWVATNAAPHVLQTQLKTHWTASQFSRLQSINCALPHANVCLDLASSVIADAQRSAAPVDDTALKTLCSPTRAVPLYIRDRVALTTLERASNPAALNPTKP